MRRAALLGALALAGVLAATTLAAGRHAAKYTCNGQIQKVFDNSNGFPVANGGTRPTFTTTGAFCVTSIQTYHWNGGAGTSGVSLSLVHTSGPAGFDTVGPFAATGSAGQNNAPNVNWRATLDTNSSPTVIDGTYQCADSDLATWSNNATSGNQGFCTVYGIPAQLVDTTPATTAATTTHSTTTTRTEPPDEADLATKLRVQPGVAHVVAHDDLALHFTLTVTNNGPDAAYGVESSTTFGYKYGHFSEHDMRFGVAYDARQWVSSPSKRSAAHPCVGKPPPPGGIDTYAPIKLECDMFALAPGATLTFHFTGYLKIGSAADAAKVLADGPVHARSVAGSKTPDPDSDNNVGNVEILLRKA